MVKNNFKASILMLIHALSVATLFVLVKFLSQDLSSSLVVFLYKFILVILILPWLLVEGKKIFYTSRIKEYIIGGIFGTSATLCLMYAIKHVPVANATALGYLEKILLILVGVIYFKEKITIKEVVAIIICMIGAIIVIFPKLDFNLYNYNYYYCYIFVSVMLWTSYCLVIKSLGKTENIKTQTFYTILISTIFSIPVAFFNWQEFTIIRLDDLGLSLQHIPLLLLTSICYFVISITAIKAYKYGDLAVVSPLGYSKVLFSGILGALFFHEYPANSQYLGYIMIILSACYLGKKRYFKR
jgi:drug/metabolite transporter (DMT)-like permease